MIRTLVSYRQLRDAGGGEPQPAKIPSRMYCHHGTGPRPATDLRADMAFLQRSNKNPRIAGDRDLIRVQQATVPVVGRAQYSLRHIKRIL